MYIPKQRETQTKIKHEILKAYLDTWGGIIANGLREPFQTAWRAGKASNFRARFVYVDCFSFSGRYAPENGETTWGSPVIGVQAMDSLKTSFIERVGFEPEVQSILIEIKQNQYNELLNTLNEIGVGNRVKETADFSSLKNGEIATIRGDYLDYLDQLVAFTSQEYLWSLYFLDTYGPMGIPLKAVSRIISQPKSDVIINFPFLGIQRVMGSAVRGSADVALQARVKYCNEMYSTDEWIKIAADYRQGTISQEQAEKAHVELYESVLQEQDTGIKPKRIPLQFHDKKRNIFYLFLTTHNATGALKLNSILDSALIREFDYRLEQRIVKSETMLMFPIKEITKGATGRPTELEVDINALANHIQVLCKGEQVKYSEVLRRMANSPYYLEDIEKAVKTLKKTGKVNYSTKDLFNKTDLSFT